MSNIQNTKNKLTLTFTIIVFIVILSFWVIFFTTKYINWYTWEKGDLSRMSQSINKDNIKLQSVLEFQEEIRRNNPRNNRGDQKVERELLGRWGLNFILLNMESEIVSYNIKVEIEDIFLEEILTIKQSQKIINKDNFLISTIPFQEKYSLVLFQKMKYNLWDYLTEMLYFLILSVLFSWLIYYVWKKFVNKAFIPVEENIDDMKNFIHNAGHELKTPLAVIDSNLQLVDEMKIYDKEMNGENKTELKKLNSLIDSLVQLTDIDSLKTKEKVNVKHVLEEVLEEYKSKITDKNILTSLKMEEDINITTHRDYLYMFLSNLIGNAIKYNIEGWSIDIIYSKGELVIKDTGVWISDEDKDKIWNRFFQTDSSRWWEGFGIWLSLVKKISEIYKWKIRVEDNKEKWSIFSIKF